ncbi:MAG: DUF5906 domain-containing protein [Oscillospiraceae bacterium]|nr:DUF5906 domain-containing protein [Oscillospiraceae bacterium]
MSNVSDKLALLDEVGFTPNPQTGPESIPVKPGDYSDAGNAEIFTREYRNRAIWTCGGGWFVWTGTHWEQGDHRAVDMALLLSLRMLDEALAAHGTAQRRAAGDDTDEKAAHALKDAKAYLAHVNATRRRNRIEAALALSEPALFYELSAFDPHPLELNTPAGIVDLATGAIRPHSPTAMCSKITKTAPGDTGRQMWGELLKTVTEGDDKLAWFLQQVAGMSLIGKVYHEGIIIAHGGGRNGKSTFFNAIADTLGSYAGHIAVNTLTTERTNKGATLATLRGKRLILTGELEEHQRLSVAMLKALASTDTLVAEEKFRAPESFRQSHTICLFTNHLPRVGSTDGGTWRRLTVVPFDAVISAENAIQNYGEALAERAAPAILQWAIDGAVDFARAGYRLSLPERVAMATEEYQAREDWIANFISECCTQGDRVAGGELYAAYREWAQGAGEYVRRQSDFVAGMESAGYRKLMSNGRNYWTGLVLESSHKYGSYNGYYSAR